MKDISASTFKSQCLAILDNLEPDGLIITKHRRPVAKLTPIKGRSSDLVGALKGKIKINGDILSTGIKWSAES